MKLTLKIGVTESDSLQMLEAALKRYDAELTREGGDLILTAYVDAQQYAEILCLVSCFECYDAKVVE